MAPTTVCKAQKPNACKLKRKPVVNKPDSEKQQNTIVAVYYGKKFRLPCNSDILPNKGNVFETIEFQFRGAFEDVINNVPLLNPVYPLFQVHRDRLVSFDPFK